MDARDARFVKMFELYPELRHVEGAMARGHWDMMEAQREFRQETGHGPMPRVLA